MYLPGPSSKHLVSGQRGQLKVAGKESAKRAGHNPNPRMGREGRTLADTNVTPGTLGWAPPMSEGEGSRKGAKAAKRQRGAKSRK